MHGINRLSLVLLGVAAAAYAEPLRLASPGGHVKAQIDVDAQGRLTWAATLDGAAALEPSPLGWVVDGARLGEHSRLGAPRLQTLQDRYPVMGPHREASYACCEAAIPVSDGAVAWTLRVRVFDDGAAVRYDLPAPGGARLTGDLTSWTPPAGAKVWWSPYGYETLHQGGPIDSIPAGKALSPPATVELPGGAGFMTLTEADNSSFADMGLVREGGRLAASWVQAPKDGWTAPGPVVSPWRVAILARDLTALVNSDLLTDLCPPPRADLAGADWIKPGRALWHWMAVGDPAYGEQHAWVDAAQQLGFEYYLVDDGWKKWKTDAQDSWACLREVVDYAKAKHVGILVWVACKDLWKAADRRAYLERVAATGARGIKIDFFPPAHAETIQWMEGALADTADLHLLCNFHGCVKPTGRRRTWPQEPTREAIHGHEWHMTRYHRVMPFDQSTILPFTRFVAGPADYTPVVFNPAELNGYTWSGELAQAIVFTSPVQHYADHFKFLLANPNVDLLKAIPTTWDETRILPGTKIGEVVASARRSGGRWFVGVMNGKEARTLRLPLDFLGAGAYALEQTRDVAGRGDAAARSASSVGRTDALTLELQPGGGFVGMLTPAASQNH